MLCSSRMFNSDIIKWNTGEITQMESIFDDSKLFNIGTSEWVTSTVLDMNSMFATNPNSAFNIYVSKWDISDAINMHCMFYNAKVIKQKNCWDISGKKKVACSKIVLEESLDVIKAHVAIHFEIFFL